MKRLTDSFATEKTLVDVATSMLHSSTRDSSFEADKQSPRFFLPILVA